MAAYFHSLALSLLSGLNAESSDCTYSVEYDDLDLSYSLSYSPLGSDYFYFVSCVYDAAALCDVLYTLISLNHLKKNCEKLLTI